ncbi:MAG: DNA repair protein RecO [Bacteroidales bacterium]|nr:DNA repair protein RecO [Bacteroidales bacterium]
MIVSTKGIILHRLKFSDSKIIAKIYTEKFGLQSYLIFGSDSKKGKQVKSLLQPFFLVDIQVYHNEKKTLQKIKEISNSFPFISIPFEIQKSTVSLFISELIMRVLKENEPDNDLFNFFITAIKAFDSQAGGFQNFHVFFLAEFCKYLGIKPENNYSTEKSTFDLDAGRFITGRPNHKYYVNQKLSRLLGEVLKIRPGKAETLIISNEERKHLLDLLIDYYKIHLGEPTQMKTLSVLKQIF